MKGMIKKNTLKKSAVFLAMGMMCSTATLPINASADSEKEVTLSFMIWDSLQQDGMEQMVAAFEEENPNIHVEIEVTPWDQYWTKIQAAATGGTLPDVFWMHPEQVYTYARGGMLMDMTELISKSENVDMSKYPENVTQDFLIDGSQYAIPKDYSTFGLWYNKDIFDAAGMEYPDETWTWETLQDAAEKLTDKENGTYGLLVQFDGQSSYCYIWQNGGDIINQEETKSGYDDPATIEAVEYMVSFIENGYSPSMLDYANTTADQYFESGRAAMHIGGSWMASEYLGIEDLNCDVAPLVKGKQRGGLCGGMGYSIASNTKHPEEAWKFMEFLAGEEANTIQCKSGAAISAYEGTQESWVEGFPPINAQVFIDAASYGYSSEYCETRSEWSDIETEYMNQIFSLQMDPEEGCIALAKEIDSILSR